MAGRVIGTIKKQYGDLASARLARKLGDEALAEGRAGGAHGPGDAARCQLNGELWHSSGNPPEGERPRRGCEILEAMKILYGVVGEGGAPRARWVTTARFSGGASAGLLRPVASNCCD